MGKVVFSVFQETQRVDGDGLPPIVPLDTIAFEGFCIIEAKVNDYFQSKGSKNYTSPLLFCPTWGELLKIAELQIKATKDISHCYLESVKPTGEKRNMGNFEATVLRFFMGS